MITNADITIYNRKYNKETRLDEWYRTVICGVHFYADNKVTIGESGLKSADIFKIRIPKGVEYEKTYLSENEYVNAEDVSNSWTLQKDDYIVRGICEREIEKPADLKEIHTQYCKITSWSDNRFGGQPHWKVGGE